MSAFTQTAANLKRNFMNLKRKFNQYAKKSVQVKISLRRQFSLLF